MSNKKTPGIIISTLNASVDDSAKRKMVFDSRENIFRFVNRREYKYKVSIDGKVRHDLGYSPFLFRFLERDKNFAGDTLTTTPLSESSFEVDDVYIYTTINGTSFFDPPAGDLTFTLIGTDNLDGPADETIFIDGIDGLLP